MGGWCSQRLGELLSFYPKTGEIQSIDAAHGVADEDARWITRLGDKLLIATRGGVQFYGGGTDFRTLDGEPANTLFVDRDGFLWAGTDDGQVKKFAWFGGHTLQTIYSGEVHALTASRINSFAQDGQGRIWIATDKGGVRHIPLAAPPPTHMSIEVDGRTSGETGDPGSGSYEIPYGRHRITFRFASITMSGRSAIVWVNPERGDERWECCLFSKEPSASFVSRLSEGAHTLS